MEVINTDIGWSQLCAQEWAQKIETAIGDSSPLRKEGKMETVFSLQQKNYWQIVNVSLST